MQKLLFYVKRISEPLTHRKRLIVNVKKESKRTQDR